MTTIKISPNRESLDYEWLFRTLGDSYWGAHLTKTQILKAVDQSLCFSAYLEDGRQVGFARVLTDRAIFSSLCDMIVEDGHRFQGVGTAMMGAIVAHPWVAPTLCVLETRNAAAFYRKFGFEGGAMVMKRQPTP